MRTSFIINSYNRIELLEKCLDTIIPYCIENSLGFYIHIIDAGSNDGSVERIHQLSERHNFLTYEVLVGSSFSKGCNAAVEYVQRYRQDVRYILLFETDNFLTSISPILTAIKFLTENSKAGSVGFSVTNFNGKYLIPGSTFLKPIATVFGLKASHYLKLERIPFKFVQKFHGFYFQEYQVIYTSPLLLSIDVWNKVGGMDEKLFPFCESDSDLAYRIFKSGFKNYLLHTDAIIHDNMENVSSWSDRRVFDLSRARLAYMRKHNGILLSYIIRPLLFVRHIIEALYFLYRKKSFTPFFNRIRLAFISLKGYAQH